MQVSELGQFILAVRVIRAFEHLSPRKGKLTAIDAFGQQCIAAPAGHIFEPCLTYQDSNT